MKSISEPTYEALLAWLVSQRKAKGLSQEALAIRLGLASHSYVSKIESKERRLDVLEYFKICRELEIPFEEGMRLLEKTPTNYLN